MKTHPRIDIQDIKSRIDLRDIARQLIGEPVKSNRDHDIHFSPWRNDGQKASFAVYHNRYKDYGGSGEYGDALDFVQRQRGLDFLAALQWLADWAGHRIILSGVHRVRPQPASPNEPPNAEWQHTSRKLLAETQKFLWSKHPAAQKARSYLHQRGLSDDTIRQAGLGFNPDWRWEGKLSLAPGIVIPYEQSRALWWLRVRCPVGDLATPLGRTEDPTMSKYLNFTGSKVAGTLYGGDGLDGRPTLIVEGEFDALLAQQELGPDICVVTPGPASNRLASHWLKRLELASMIRVLMDNDPAGEQAAQSLLKALGPKAQLVRLPFGKDVTEFTQQGGKLSHSILHDYAIVIDQQNAAARPTVKPYWWAGDMPDGYRSALLAYLPASIAPLFERLNAAFNSGELDPHRFTISEYRKLNRDKGWKLTPTTITGGFEAAVKAGFFRKCPPEEKPTGGKKLKNPGGRPAEVYQAMPLETLKANIRDLAWPRIYEHYHQTEGEEATLAYQTTDMLQAEGVDADLAEINTALAPAFEAQGQKQKQASMCAKRAFNDTLRSLDDSHSTPLLPENYTNSPDYRVILARSYLADNPGYDPSRSEWARLLGVEPRSVKRILNRAGIRTTPQFEDAHLSPGNLDQRVNAGARAVRGYPKEIVILHQGRVIAERGYRQGDAGLAGYVQAMREQGCEVRVRCQVRNHHEVYREAVLPERRPRPDLMLPIGLAAKSLTPQPRTSTTPKAAAKKPFFGKGHNPAWIKAQLKLALVLLGWSQHSDGWINRDTGVILRSNASPKTMLEAIVDHTLKAYPPVAVVKPGADERLVDLHSPNTRWKRVPLFRSSQSDANQQPG